jgi:F-type H+-transporting ATPase subunit epsilon
MAITVKLSVTVKTPEGTVFQGEATALSSINTNGPFDVLPFHANLISLIKKKLIIYQDKGNKKELNVDNGVIKVSKNTVEIFLGV